MIRCGILLVVCVLACVPQEVRVSFKPQHVMSAISPIIIDGYMNEVDWNKAQWNPINHVWIGQALEETDFKGKYKLLWTVEALYIFAEIHDDVLVDSHPDPLDRYWDDDCLEIFIDADASGGNHQYNHNAFAYHIGLDGRVIDIGTDSLPHEYDHVVSKRRQEGQISFWECQVNVYDDTYIDRSYAFARKLTAGEEMGFAIAYCDNDGSAEREHFIGSERVDGTDKNRGWIDASIFGKIILNTQ